jgi:hypothetical protein
MQRSVAAKKKQSFLIWFISEIIEKQRFSNNCIDVKNKVFFEIFNFIRCFFFFAFLRFLDVKKKQQVAKTHSKEARKQRFSSLPLLSVAKTLQKSRNCRFQVAFDLLFFWLFSSF